MSARRRGLPSTPAGVRAPPDRRFRRPDIRPGRRRRASALVRFAVRVVLPTLLLALGTAWAGARVLGSPLLDVDHIAVRGTSRLSQAEVERLLEGVRGANVLAVDLEACRSRLLGSPWVADATVVRVLPSTIELRIVERRPMAVARLAGQLYLIDDAGVIIDAYGPAYDEFNLPIVDGLVEAAPKGQYVASPERVRLAAAFLAALGEADDLRETLSQVDVSNPHDVAVLLDGDPAWLHLGEEGFVDRLRFYLEMAPSLHERLPDLDYVDLRFGERVVARARDRQATRSRD